MKITFFPFHLIKHILHIDTQSHKHTHKKNSQKAFQLHKSVGNIIIKKPLNQATIWKFTLFWASKHSKWMKNEIKKVLGFFRLVDWTLKGPKRGRKNRYWKYIEITFPLRDFSCAVENEWKFLFWYTNKYQ